MNKKMYVNELTTEQICDIKIALYAYNIDEELFDNSDDLNEWIENAINSKIDDIDFIDIKKIIGSN